MIVKAHRLAAIRVLTLAGILLFGGLLSVVQYLPEAGASSLWASYSFEGFNGTGCQYSNTGYSQDGGPARISLNATGDWSAPEMVLGPSARYSHAMAQIGPAGKVLMFGGSTGYSNSLAETWLYDPSDGSWTELFPKNVPPGRSMHAMASVGGDDKLILFGGWGFGPPLCDTWVFDLSDNDWHLQEPAIHPPPTWTHSMASFSNDPRVLLFGGRILTGPGEVNITSATWLFDHRTAKWSTVQPAVSPSARCECAMAGVWNDNRAVLFGGFPFAPPLSDTWIFDLGLMSWIPKAPETFPEARDSHSLASIPGGDRILLFGDSNYPANEPHPSDTWTYDVSDDQWYVKSPTKEPAHRSGAAMAPAGNGSVILFGGASAAGAGLSDYWTYNISLLAPDGFYISPLFDAGAASDMLSICWTASLPAGTGLRFQARSGTSLPDISSHEFSGPDGTGTSYFMLSPSFVRNGAGRQWFQYKAFLSSSDRSQSPSLERFELVYDLHPLPPAPAWPPDGAWTNDSIPAFEWTFNDTDSATQGGYDVQACRDLDFARLDYTSGAVDSAISAHRAARPIADNMYYWRVRTRDAEGAWGPFSEPRQVGIDTAPPDDFEVRVDRTGWSRGPFWIFFNTSDGLSGISHFEVSVDGAFLGRKESPFTLPPLANGLQLVVVEAVDRAGNRAGASVELLADLAAPEPFAPAAVPASWTNGTVVVTFSAVDNESGISHYTARLDDGDFMAAVSPWTLPVLSDGRHNITVRAFDRVGNSRDAGLAVYIDRSAPVDILVTLSPGDWSNTDPQLTFSAHDTASGIGRFELRSNSGGFAPVTSPNTLYGLPEGQNTVVVRAYDNAGNFAEARMTVGIDRTPPGNFRPAASPPGWTRAPPVLVFSANDTPSGIDRYEVSIDGGPWGPAPSPFQLPALPDGWHNATVRAFDRAGNFLDGLAGIYLDATPPESTCLRINGGAGRTASAKVSLSISARDNLSRLEGMCFSNDGVNYSDWEPFAAAAKWELAGGAGPMTVHLKVRDGAGNVADPVAATILYEQGGSMKAPASVAGIAGIALAAAAFAAYLAWRRRRNRGG